MLAFSLASFAFIAIAAHQIGHLATRLHLPLISGYLVAGILSGPFILQFMGSVNVESLRFLDEMALGFIAFVAGSEMALDELRGRYRSIGWNTLAQIVAVYIVSGIGILLLADHIPLHAGHVAAGQTVCRPARRHDPGSAFTFISDRHHQRDAGARTLYQDSARRDAGHRCHDRGALRPQFFNRRHPAHRQEL